MKQNSLATRSVAIGVGAFGMLGCTVQADGGDEIGDIGTQQLAATLVNAAAVPTLNALIRKGADLFFNEEFNGNGRTCGSCHRAENNLTIDPAFIATLPNDDALFVAEFVPALAQNFEKPLLMRQLGLILENVDGQDDLANKFTMRGVPHTLALSSSLTPAVGDGTTTPPNQRTGWSGDGAPGNGTLREFAIGAVTQHFPRTLGRQAGVDFRLPTDAELDAMEAFQLFSGRDGDLNLVTLQLKGTRASAGKTAFLSAEARCNACHSNAGANASFGGGGNRNFNTGVERFSDPADVVDPANSRPDEGFGSAPSPTVPGGFGNGTFNSVALVEAADTGPFFHNNIVNSIEEAVAFYTSAAFNNSPSGTPNINLSQAQILNIAAFLRVINSLENIRTSVETLTFIRNNTKAPQNQDLFTLTLAEIDDALQVLVAPPLPGQGTSAVSLHPTATHNLNTARLIVVQSKAHPPGSQQQAYVALALFWLNLAKADMVQ